MELKLLYRQTMKGEGRKEENEQLENLNENESIVLLRELKERDMNNMKRK